MRGKAGLEPALHSLEYFSGVVVLPGLARPDQGGAATGHEFHLGLAALCGFDGGLLDKLRQRFAVVQHALDLVSHVGRDAHRGQLGSFHARQCSAFVMQQRMAWESTRHHGGMSQPFPSSAPPSVRAGVDIGGTKVAVCLAGPPGGDAPPALRVRLAEPTVKTGEPDALVRQVLRLLDAACAQHGLSRNDLAAVGVASCGPFVRPSGLAELANPNICGGLAGAPRGLGNGWTRVPLEAPLVQALGAERVRIVNDAVAALQAERRWGALRGVQDCAYVTWSTGIGTGLCVDGRVLHGKHGNAGHAGHSFVGDAPGQNGQEGPLCGCGNRGDVESLVAGSALMRQLGANAPALLRAADAGDDAALAEVRGLCVLMGRLLYNLVATLDLRRISLGGAVFLHHQALLLPLLRAELARYFPALTDEVELVSAGLGERVGDYAALALLEKSF